MESITKTFLSFQMFKFTSTKSFSIYFKFTVMLICANLCLASFSEDLLTGYSLTSQGKLLNYELSTRASVFGDITPANLQTTCEAYMERYAEAASNFTKCAILHARPLRVCTNCVEEYVNAKSIFTFINDGKVIDENQRSCGEILLNADRSQIMVQYENHVENIWDDCKCVNCFEDFDYLNTTIEVKLNNQTLIFLDLMKKTEDCINNYTKNDVWPMNSTVNHTICTACLNDYDALNDHYNQMWDVYHNQMCMDVADHMNYTRLEWSRNFGCSRFQGEKAIIIVAAVVLGLIPVAFYIGVKVKVKSPKLKLAPAKRYTESTVPNSHANEVTFSQQSSNQG